MTQEDGLLAEARLLIHSCWAGLFIHDEEFFTALRSLFSGWEILELVVRINGDFVILDYAMLFLFIISKWIEIKRGLCHICILKEISWASWDSNRGKRPIFLVDWGSDMWLSKIIGCFIGLIDLPNYLRMVERRFPWRWFHHTWVITWPSRRKSTRL